MIPKDKDLILQEKVKLYNNIAKTNDCEGRLLAELEVYPTPRIIWEFEILGNVSCNLFNSSPFESGSLNSLIGHCFSIEKPVFLGDYNTVVGPLRAIRGDTDQAIYGDMENIGHGFVFYLTNTRFQQQSVRQGQLLKSIQESTSNKQVASGHEGRYIRSFIDNVWSISLKINQDSLNWLNPQNRNTGTLITTVGELYLPKSQPTEPENLSELQTITLNNALERWQLIQQAIQWIDEVLLWRLGYSGEYLDRTQKWSTSISPRYDLSLRDSNW